jgi:8-oxo-dGTP diphosphatase
LTIRVGECLSRQFVGGTAHGPMSEALPRIGSALLVRDEANRILLGQRNKDPLRGSWVIPGGKIHAFESIAGAAAREIEEETGLSVEVGDQFRVYEIINPPNEHRIVIYSWGKARAGIPKASDDLSDVRFFSVEELGDVPLTPLVRGVLEDAGLLRAGGEALSREKAQLNFFFFPVPLVGVQMGRSARRGRQSYAPRTRRKRQIANIPLLFK